jgi:hypothetical protein
MIHVLQVVTRDLTEYPLQELPKEYMAEFVVTSSIRKNTVKYNTEITFLTS